MNFIESMLDSFNKAWKRGLGEYPNEIRSFCIGSGSNFTIHKYISYSKAEQIYNDYKAKLPLGRKIKKTESGYFTLESYHTLESNSGVTYCFLFPVSEVIEHNPNDVIDEWIDRDKKQKGFMKDLLEDLEKEVK